MRLTVIFATLALAIPAFSAPPLTHVIEKFAGPTTGRFIVKLKDGVSQDSILKQADAKVTHTYDLFNGFAGEFDIKALDIFRALPDIEYISEDGIMHTTGTITQTDAPWGLSRLSSVDKLPKQDASSLTFSYTYDSRAGKDVDIFIIGVRTTHSQFGGRAKWGKTFGGYADADGHGHGTHCAGIAAGSQFGVAKEANIIAVKVLSDSGSGSTADIIAGMNYAATTAKDSRRPSVVSMSLGGPALRALDDAVASLTEKGIHVVAAAGNDNTLAEFYSPARAPSAVTVGASTIADAKASFSNSGRVLDIFAPGQDIISAWKDGDTATKSLSGTSMAAPHVAGLVAYLISLKENTSPAKMSETLKNMSLKKKLTGMPLIDFFPHPWNTPNYLAHNT